MVTFYKTGIVDATGDDNLVDKTGTIITNINNDTHGFAENDSGTQAMSIFDNYILADEFIEY